MKKSLFLIALLALALGARADENAAKLALAREAISAMQVDKMFDAMLPQMKQMAAQMTQVPPDMPPEAQKKMGEFQDKVMELAVSEIKGMLTQLDGVYAEVYSEAELKAMIAFFRSPEGASMQAKQPQVMAKMMPMAQQMQQGMMGKMMKLAEEFKAELEALKAAQDASAPTPAAK